MNKQKIKLSAFLLLMLGACNPENEAPPKQYTIQQFMDVKNIFSAGFSAISFLLLPMKRASITYLKWTLNRAKKSP